MVQLVLSTGGFYYSSECDLSHSLQFLSRQATADFYQKTLFERVNNSFFIFLLNSSHFRPMKNFCGTKNCAKPLIQQRLLLVAVIRFSVPGEAKGDLGDIPPEGEE